MKTLRIPSSRSGTGFALATLATLGLAASAYAQSTPLSLTGYNQAGIATGANDGSAASVQAAVTASTTGPLDSQYVFYTPGFDAAAPTTGLPAGTTFVSASNPAVTFAVQAASPTGASGLNNNVLLLSNSNSGVPPTSSATLTLASPASYSSLSFLVFAGHGDHNLTYSLNFDSGPATTPPTVIAPDGFDSKPAYAYSIAGRVGVGGTSGASGFANVGVSGSAPYLFEDDVTLSAADAGRTLTSITFSDPQFTGNTSQGKTIGIFGVSGVPGVAATPEPSQLAALGLGALGLGALAFKSRRRGLKAA